jgi:hypothetical protein
MDGLTIYDFLLFPIYLYVVFLIFKKLRLKYKDQKHLYLYFTWGFRIKIVIIIAYTLLSHFVIRGDAIDLYFGEGKHFAQIIKNDLSQIDLLFTKGGKKIDNLASPGQKGYLAMESNFLVVKVCVLLCFISFSSFLIINLIMGFIAFLGSWQLYLFFLKQYPKLHKEFAFACLGIPTVLFWSAGISKDTICIACIGILTKSLYDISRRGGKMIRNIMLVIASVFLIYNIKSYIIVSYVPFFLLFLIFSKINETKIVLFRWALKLCIPLVFIGAISYVVVNSEDLLKEYSSEKILNNIARSQFAFTAQDIEGGGSFFTLGEFDGSIGGLVSMAPKAIVATFFRPFIWESRNLIMLLSSLEAMALFFFFLYTLFKPRGIRTFFLAIFKNTIVIYCLGFALVFAVFVGISTFNFGSLVRYKIPCIPFFVCGLAIINYIRLQKIKSLKEA